MRQVQAAVGATLAPPVAAQSQAADAPLCLAHFQIRAPIAIEDQGSPPSLSDLDDGTLLQVFSCLSIPER